MESQQPWGNVPQNKKSSCKVLDWLIQGSATAGHQQTPGSLPCFCSSRLCLAAYLPSWPHAGCCSAMSPKSHRGTQQRWEWYLLHNCIVVSVGCLQGGLETSMTNKSFSFDVRIGFPITAKLQLMECLISLDVCFRQKCFQQIPNFLPLIFRLATFIPDSSLL